MICFWDKYVWMKNHPILSTLPFIALLLIQRQVRVEEQLFFTHNNLINSLLSILLLLFSFFSISQFYHTLSQHLRLENISRSNLHQVELFSTTFYSVIGSVWPSICCLATNWIPSKPSALPNDLVSFFLIVSWCL